MAAFILRPWPFEKNEEVELYWLCSPHMNTHREWRIKVILKYNDTIKAVNVPWGTLPYLRLGQKYKDGIAIDSYKRGRLGEVKINDETFEICNSFDIPPKLFYLYKNYEYGMQKMCKFTVEGTTYYIPCIEVIRSFFAKSKTLTNYILKPNGLDFLISDSKIISDCLNILLSIEIPEKIANNETAAHLGWIKYNEEAFKSWTSIYGNMFDNENTNSNYIQLLPPVRHECKWNYRGIISDKSVLVLELISSTGLRTPFKYVKFSHPKIFRNKVTETPDKIKRTKTENGEPFEMTNSKNGTGTRKQQNQPTIELSSTQFVFENIIKIEKVKDKEKEIFVGTKIISKGDTSYGNAKENTIKVSTEDWSSGGKIEPIEFKSLEIVKGRTCKGLEEFYKVIQYIAGNYKQFKISIVEVFLPKSLQKCKTFSYYHDGDRRTCAIVKIQYDKGLPCYILEVGRADNWSISTLIICQCSYNMPDEHIEQLINYLFTSLINNSGHWDKELFITEKGYYLYTLKHYNSNSNLENWALRIINKILK